MTSPQAPTVAVCGCVVGGFTCAFHVEHKADRPALTPELAAEAADEARYESRAAGR